MKRVEKKVRQYTWVRDDVTEGLKVSRPWLTPVHVNKVNKVKDVNSVDLSLTSNRTPIIDQGALGSCGECSALSALAYQTRKQGIKIGNVFSILFLYYNVRAREGTISTDSGSQLSDVMLCLQHQGVCSSALWPYNINKFRDRPTTECYNNGMKHMVSKFYKIHQTIDNIKQTLIKGFTIVFGFIVYSSFESNYTLSTGKMIMPKKGESILGGHAVEMVGFNDRTQYVKFKNSWGVDCGDKGYFYMPYAYVLNPQYASDFYVIESVKWV
jgi:C1A family cysteine protease